MAMAGLKTENDQGWLEIDGLKIRAEFSNPTISLILTSPTTVTKDGPQNLFYVFSRTGDTSNSLTVNFTVAGNANFNSDYGQGGDGHGLPALLINRQHVIAHESFDQLIGGPFSLVLVGATHKQIGIREPIPNASGQGAVAEGSAGVQPDAAIVFPQGVAQALAQRRCRSRRRSGAKVFSLTVIRHSYGRRDSTALALAIL
jgi:hypothetical protein